MRKILTMLFAFVSVVAMGQEVKVDTGALTSADIYRGEGNVLKIDSLVEYVKSLVKAKEDILNLHPSTSENFVTTTYSYGGKHTKEVTISCNLTQIPDRPMGLTGDTKKDSASLFWTHYYREQGLLYQQAACRQREGAEQKPVGETQ